METNFIIKKGLEPPYAALWQAQSRQLLYIVADHTIDPKSKTFELINRAFKEYRPDFVIIEGLE